MKNIEDINKANLQKLIAGKKIPEFFPGDTIRVGVRIVEVKEKGFKISKVFVLQKKIEI